MRNTALAEWLLSLVTPPDRAASTVGDLIEDSAGRSRAWFWSNVLRVAASHIVREFRAAPFRMFRSACWGVAAYWCIGAAIGVSMSVLIRVQIDRDTTGPAPWILPVFSALMYTAIPFLVGWLTARRYKGRELSSAASVIILLNLAATLVMCLSELHRSGTGAPLPLPVPLYYALAVAETLLLDALLLAGAVLSVRRRIPTMSSNPSRLRV